MPALNVGVNDQIITRKELGAYYTPSALTSVLSTWAIRSSSDLILEPSFGGCGFLESAVERLSELCCQSPQNQLYGCDVDPQAFLHLSNKLGAINNIDQRYILSDFLTVLPEHFLSNEFDVVIGNPPYVSHHDLSEQQKISVQSWRNKNNIKISGRASLWAYFVLHAMSFLRRGGRMAWVLPGSFLQSHYGRNLQAALLPNFENVSTIRLGDRLFLSEGTEERTVILLCSGFGQFTDKLDIQYCDSIADLSQELSRDHQNQAPVYQFVHPVVSEELNDDRVYQTVANGDGVISLGQLGRVMIGTVTGANRFFVISQSKATKYNLEASYLKPILSKFGHIPGVQVTQDDADLWRHTDKRCLLFHVPSVIEVSEAATAYMAQFPENKRGSNSTFKRRKDWLAADDGKIPDGFLSYMTHDGPRLVLNNAGLNATNSIHRFYFSGHIQLHTQKLAVISLCTTFSQLSAEIEGRSYGSGVLKIEPSEAKRIKLVLPEDKSEEEINVAFAQIDACFRTGEQNKARKLADEFIFGNGGDASTQTIKPLMDELSKYRKRRKRSTQGSL